VSRLMSDVRTALRARHYNRRTEQAYCLWVRRFIRFHALRHPADMGEPEINAFLTHLASEGQVSASTQTQALSALLFLYRNVVHRDVGALDDLVRARKPRRLPVVLTRDEVKGILDELDGGVWLIASLLYGSGLRLTECLRLRVQDVELARLELTVHDGKGGKDRVTMLPRSLAAPLCSHLARVPAIHERDLAAGWDRVELPYPAASLRDAPARRQLRHPHHPGAARPQRRAHDDALHACAEPRRARRPQSARRPLTMSYADRHNTVPRACLSRLAQKRVACFVCYAVRTILVRPTPVARLTECLPSSMESPRPCRVARWRESSTPRGGNRRTQLGR